MGWLILYGLLAFLVFEIIIRFVIVRLVLPIFEEKPFLSVHEWEPDVRAERITFPTSNRLMLHASLFRQQDRAPRGLILFCPELRGNHWTVMRYAEALWLAGFDLLSFDFRNHGESDDQPGYQPQHWVTELEIDDVKAALEYIRQHPELNSLPLGAFGVSRGGSAALVAASRFPQIQRVATDSAFAIDDMMEWYTRHWARLYVPPWVLALFPRFHIRSTLVLARWISRLRTGYRYCVVGRSLRRLRNKPVLMITGSRDAYVKPDIVAAMARQIGPECDLWVVPGARHNAARSSQPGEYDARLVEFFSEMDDPSSPAPPLPQMGSAL